MLKEPYHIMSSKGVYCLTVPKGMNTHLLHKATELVEGYYVGDAECKRLAIGPYKGE